MIKRIILTILLAVTAVCITGCCTVEGFGSDLQWTGQQIEKVDK